MLFHNPHKFSAMARCNIVIIGNAPYDFKLPLGMFIDSFENIMRFNAFSVTGHEKYVGSKTTIWCYWPHSHAMQKLHSCATHNIKGQEIVYGITLKGLSKRENQTLKKKVNDGLVKIIPRKHTFDKLRLKHPSTGITGIAWALYEGYRPLVIGFNGFSNKKSQHYYEQWNKNKCTIHSGNKEIKLLKELHQKGEIYFLDNSTVE